MYFTHSILCYYLTIQHHFLFVNQNVPRLSCAIKGKNERASSSRSDYNHALCSVTHHFMSNTKPNPAQADAQWWVYMLLCADDSLYTGITTNVDRRVSEHNGNSASAAKYTRSRRPVKLIYLEAAKCRSTASKREFSIKRLHTAQKHELISCPTNNLCHDDNA